MATSSAPSAPAGLGAAIFVQEWPRHTMIPLNPREYWGSPVAKHSFAVAQATESRSALTGVATAFHEVPLQWSECPEKPTDRQSLNEVQASAVSWCPLAGVLTKLQAEP